MKFNLKSILATSLAAIMACAPLAAFSVSGNAKAYTPTEVGFGDIHMYEGNHYHRVESINMLKRIVIVSTDDNGNAYALSAARSTSNNGIGAEPVVIVEDGEDCYLSSDANPFGFLNRSYFWHTGKTARAEGDIAIIVNEYSARYLGTLSGIYTWQNEASACGLSYDGTNLIMSTSAYTDKYIVFNGTEFVLSETPGNPVYVFEYDMF